jgi:hypothetical protein
MASFKFSRRILFGAKGKLAEISIYQALVMLAPNPSVRHFKFKTSLRRRQLFRHATAKLFKNSDESAKIPH